MWTAPRFWLVNEFLTAALLNEQLSANAAFLHSAHENAAHAIPGAAWSTASTSFVDWNGASPLEVAFTKQGGQNETGLLVSFYNVFFVTSSPTVVRFRVNLNNATPLQFAHPSLRAPNEANHYKMAYGTIPIPVGTVVDSGQRLIRLQVKVDSGGGSYSTDGFCFAALHVKEHW